MLDFSGLKTLQSEDEYQAALKAVRPYFAHEPDADTLPSAKQRLELQRYHRPPLSLPMLSCTQPADHISP